MRSNVTIDTNKIAMRIRKAADSAIAITAQQILKDCNYYAPQDTGALINSSITHSEPGKGILVWEMPYARYLYYGVTKSGKEINYSKQPNIHAGKMWCEKAYAEHHKEWNRMLQKSFEKLMG